MANHDQPSDAPGKGNASASTESGSPSSPDDAGVGQRYTFRRVGHAEAVSYLLLLGVAMPLKYGVGWPWGVRVIGMAHGLLFIGFCYFLFTTWLDHRWPLRRVFSYFLASLLPAVPFFLSYGIRPRVSPPQPTRGN